jgi:hypothetical protein
MSVTLPSSIVLYGDSLGHSLAGHAAGYLGASGILIARIRFDVFDPD